MGTRLRVIADPLIIFIVIVIILIGRRVMRARQGKH
jgi:hypothetical protein